MNRKLLILIGVLFPYFCKCQTYSSVISDKEIEEFIQWEINNSDKHYGERKKTKKRYLNKPTSWKKAVINLMGPHGDSLSFAVKFHHFLKYDTLFTQSDYEYFKLQYESEITNNWNDEFENSKYVKKMKLRTYEVTIPIFTKSKKRLIFWKYYYCGSLCAKACLFIYEKTEKGSWKLISENDCWVS